MYKISSNESIKQAKNFILIIICNNINSNIKYRMDGGSRGSTGNLNRHLQNHIDKIDPSVEKQVNFMKKFLQNGGSENQMVNI
jgi:hypothetical protein